jgi:UMF1 family MFS transporter
MLTVAVLSPVLGAAADYYSNKKTYLTIFTALCVVSTALLYFTGEGTILLGMILFIIANIGFQAGLGFYDAFLKDITTDVNYNRVSSFGYAIGYLGSLLSLAVVIVLKDEPGYTFIACAVLFAIFSIPLLLFVKEKKREIEQSRSSPSFLAVGLKRIRDTISHIRSYRNIRNFLLSYFLYIDGVNTIIFFSANYAQTTLQFEITDLIIFFIIVQVTALAGSFIFGFIADRRGLKNTLTFVIISWAVITLSVYFADSKSTFLVIGAFAGTFLGSSQALSRSLMSRLTPEEKKTEFFGFYSLFEKTSTILGPLAFGLVSWLTGSQRYAVLTIAFFFIAGYLIFRRVSDSPERREIEV